MMKVTIPKAHGELIAERSAQLREVYQAFQVLRQEDKKHTDACLKTAGLKPEDYSQYQLEKNGDEYLLVLTEVNPPAASVDGSQAPIASVPVNGAPAVPAN